MQRKAQNINTDIRSGAKKKVGAQQCKQREKATMEKRLFCISFQFKIPKYGLKLIWDPLRIQYPCEYFSFSLTFCVVGVCFFSAARFTYFHLKNGKGKSGRARERLILSRASILHEFPKMVSLMKFMLGKMVLLVRAITTYFARFALCLLFFISLITFIVLLVCCCSHLFCNFFRSLISFTNCMVAAWNLTKPEPDLRGPKRYILRAIVMAAKLIKYT